MEYLGNLGSSLSLVSQFLWDNVISTSQSRACEALVNISNNSTFTPESEFYAQFREAHWSQTAWGKPDCIFVPHTTQDLQQALPIITKARNKFAIRSGGNMPIRGAASTGNGVLIDLSRLNNIEYQAAKHLAVVGTGLRWRHVYEHLDAYGATAVGSRAPDVGVGGFLLGGGLSYLSEMHGLACDNIVSFDVVLVNGSLVTANQSRNIDLFSALKGGGNNFGVVTSFTVRTYDVHRVWGGTIVFAWNKLDAVMEALFKFQAAQNNDPYASLVLSIAAFNETDTGITLSLVYLKPEQWPIVFALFYDIKAEMDTTQIQPLTKIINASQTPTITRAQFRAVTLRPTERMYRIIKHLMRTSPHVQTVKNLTRGTVTFTWQPVSTNLIKVGRMSGDLAMELEDVNQSWLRVEFYWFNTNDDAAVRKASNALMEEIEAFSKSLGYFLDFIFMNDANDEQHVIASYERKNYRKLWAVQKRYDPQGVFSRFAAGAFKLPVA